MSITLSMKDDGSSGDICKLNFKLKRHGDYCGWVFEWISLVSSDKS
jgi:hypothetical protein